MSQTEKKKSSWIRRHWKKVALVISVSLFTVYSIHSVESTRDQYNDVEKTYEPIFKTEEEINLLKQKATLPEDRPRDPIPDVDYESIYTQVSRSMVLFEKIGKNNMQVSEHCQMFYSYEDESLVAKANCFSLSSKQEDDGVRNAFYHKLGNKPGYFVDEKPVEKIVEEIIEQQIKENETSTGKQLEFTLKEKVGLSDQD